MKRGCLVLLIVFVVGIFGFASTASAEPVSAYIQIGEENVPLELQPAYDQDGNMASYSFNLERSDGTLSGDIKLYPPLKAGTEALLQNDEQEPCVSKYTVQVGATNGTDTPVTFQFLINVPVNIPGGRTLIASSIVDGNITDIGGDGVSVSPYNTLISQWFVLTPPPPTTLGVDLGPAVSYGPAQPNTIYPYGPYSKSEIGPPGPWSAVRSVMAFTITGQDKTQLSSSLTLNWCQPISIPTFSQYGRLIFMVLVIVSAVFYIRRMRRAT